MASNEIDSIKSLLDHDEIISPTSPGFTKESLPWAIQRDRKPTLVVRPKSVQSLSKVLANLSKTSLDFTVRSQGFGSASAKDVLVSLSAFDQFEFDRENELVILGAGQSWGDYYKKMEETAPDYTVVACRTPNIGVGGSTLCGGFSWLSGEYGCVSDPVNMLDAQVVKLDGSIIWASQEPELLWALRGSVTGFGVVTAFKFRALRYTQSIWAGPIMLPKSRDMLNQIAKGIVSMAAGPREPKLAMFLYCMRKEILAAMGATDDMLVVHAFDALGEEHGRKAFEWALNIPGSVDMTEIKNLRGVANMQAQIGEFKGTATSYWSAIVLPELTEEIIVKSFDWYDKVLAAGGSIKDCGYLLFELFCTRDSLTSRTGSAWPRPSGFIHQLLLGAGSYPSGGAAEDAKAKQLVAEGIKDVFGPGVDVDIVPNAMEDFHDVKAIYGENYSRLQMLKKKYDPENKLKGPIMT